MVICEMSGCYKLCYGMVGWVADTVAVSGIKKMSGCYKVCYEMVGQ